jgi:hypothetical protein
MRRAIWNGPGCLYVGGEYVLPGVQFDADSIDKDALAAYCDRPIGAPRAKLIDVPTPTPAPVPVSPLPEPMIEETARNFDPIPENDPPAVSMSVPVPAPIPERVMAPVGLKHNKKGKHK